MKPTEVLKMMKSKIDAATLNKCKYTIETSDMEAINQALLLYDVVGRSEHLCCDECGSKEIEVWDNHSNCKKCLNVW
jgi:hypothetical protein